MNDYENVKRKTHKDSKIYSKNIVTKKILTRNRFKSDENQLFNTPMPLINSLLKDHNNYTIISTPFQQILTEEENFINKENIKKIKHKNKAEKYVSSGKRAIKIGMKPKILKKVVNSYSQKILKTCEYSKIIDKNQPNANIIEKKEALKDVVFAKLCKICFEDTETLISGKLLAPCQCAGSMKYIHEECLKTWLVSQKKHLPTASCEICNKTYKMDFKYGLKFYWRQAFHEGLLSFILSMFLIFMIVGIVVMIILFFNKMSTSEQSNPSDGSTKQLSGTYKLAIMISCGFINSVLGILLIFSLKEAFFLKSVKKWVIHEYEKIGDVNKENNFSPEPHNDKNINLKEKTNKTFEMRFKSQSVNNLLFHSLMKLVPSVKEIKENNNFNITTNIIKIIKKSGTCAKLQKEDKNHPKYCSTGLLLQKEHMETIHIQKNNYFDKYRSYPNCDNLFMDKPNFTLEPIEYFQNNKDILKKNYQENKKLNENDDWKDIMSFKSIDEPYKVLNDGFIEKMSEEFKSFDDNEEKIIDVILNFQAKPLLNF